MLGFDFDITGTESVRQTGQAFLEKLRTDNAPEQSATPFSLANDIVGLALRYHPGTDIRFLEPCIGSGLFFSALLHEATDKNLQRPIAAAHGVEPDEHFAALAHDLWAPAGLTVHNLDFMQLTRDDLPKASLVLSRPPATPHHRLTSEQKVAAANAAESATGIRPTGLADFYIHFLLASHKFLAPGAVSAWLLPTAFLHRSAGHALRTYLTKQVRLRRIHNFDRGTLATTGHEDEIAEWSVVIFTNEPAAATDSFNFSSGGELFGPDTTVELSYERLDPEISWGNLIDDQQPKRNSYLMEDFFWIRRGWDIPGKKFFVQSENRAWALGIQPYHMHPMLPPPQDVTGAVIKSDDWGYPMADNRHVVITSHDNIYDLEDKDPALLKYLSAANGDTRAAATRPESGLWYSLHLRRPAPILVQPATDDDPGPFRFIINESDGIAGPGWITMQPKIAFATPPLLLNGIDWYAVKYALDNIRVPAASQKPTLTPSAVASLDATVIAEWIGITDQRA